MSGSPKWSEIRLEQERQRKLEEERQRRAEEERRAREEAERRAREELARELARQLDAEVAQLRASLTRSRAEPWAAEIPGGIPYLEPQIDGIVARAGSTPEGLAEALARAKHLASSLSRLAIDGQARQRQIGEAQDELRAEAAELARRLREDQAEEDRQASLASLCVTLLTRLAGMRSDEIILTWEERTLSEVGQDLDNPTGIEDPQEWATKLHRRLDEAAASAQVRQLAEERRAYIVESLRAALRDQGFQVGDPEIVGNVGLDGDVVFTAARVDQRRLDVSVAVDGPVVYTIDGVEQQPERGEDGLTYTRCDSTEERIEALHAALASRFGVEPGALLWESRDPTRLRRSANELPTGAPAAAKGRGHGR